MKICYQDNLARLLDEERGCNIISSPKVLAVKEIGVMTACALNKRWHSRLPNIDWSNVVRNPKYVCYGAMYDNQWYGVAIYSSPVAQNRMADGESVLELRRLAIAPDAPKFTATYILGKTVRMVRRKFTDIKRLISYQDTEVHTGTIYKAGNWIMVSITKGTKWTTTKRKRNVEQSIADKILWELIL